jgi:hypothetical protein
LLNLKLGLNIGHGVHTGAGRYILNENSDLSPLDMIYVAEATKASGIAIMSLLEYKSRNGTADPTWRPNTHVGIETPLLHGACMACLGWSPGVFFPRLQLLIHNVNAYELRIVYMGNAAYGFTAYNGSNGQDAVNVYCTGSGV